MMRSFLLIGQSNAAGRGFLQEAPPLDDCGGRIKMMRNGRWHKIFRPINPDRSFSGYSFAESFAKAYAEAVPEIKIGIIPCADGGTRLEQWLPGSLLFDHAVNCAKLAMRTSNLSGILWHQGEGDCLPERYSCYAERFEGIMDAMRKELGLPELPILVGGLGEFLAHRVESENTKNYPYVNEQLEKIAREYPHCTFVSAKGLGSNPDNLHFSAAALEEFGVRYFDAFRTTEAYAKSLDESEIVRHEEILTEMEKL